MSRSKVDYDSMTVNFTNKPSKEALLNYYCLLIDLCIKKYGKRIVKKALEELIKED